MWRGLAALLAVWLCVCGPAAAAITDSREERRRASDVLTEKLFAVADMITALEKHVQRLGDWEASSAALEARLTRLEAGQTRLGDQLAAVLQTARNASQDAAAAREELTGLAVTLAASEAEVRTLRDDLAGQLSGVSGAVAAAAQGVADEHGQTRGACGAGAQQLAAQLAQLQPDVRQAQQAAAGAAQAVSDGVGRLTAQVQQMGQQVDHLSEELRQQHEHSLTTTTPAPTPDSTQVFLSSLYQSLVRRNRQRSSRTTPTPPTTVTP